MLDMTVGSIVGLSISSEYPWGNEEISWKKLDEEEDLNDASEWDATDVVCWWSMTSFISWGLLFWWWRTDESRIWWSEADKVPLSDVKMEQIICRVLNNERTCCLRTESSSMFCQWFLTNQWLSSSLQCLPFILRLEREGIKIVIKVISWKKWRALVHFLRLLQVLISHQKLRMKVKVRSNRKSL